MATGMDESGKQLQASSNSLSITYKDNAVKVCDICGDAGQEDSLAICTRCTDGAEHIYCMKLMLDEPPDGDWLCEECKLKVEFENLKAHNFEIVTQKQEQSIGSLSTFKEQKAQISSDPISSAIRDDIKVISAPLVKQSSFKNANAKPKVIQLLEAIPLVNNAIGKFPSKNTRKGGLTRELVKSQSFKSTCSGSELLNENQYVNLTPIESSSLERNKELGSIERTLGCNREIPLHSSRSSSNASSNRLNLLDQNHYQVPKDGVHHHVNAANNSHKFDSVNMKFTHLDDITKVSTFAATSNKPTNGGSRILKCANTTDGSEEVSISSFGYSAKVDGKGLPTHGFRRTYSHGGRANTANSFAFDRSKPSTHKFAANRAEICDEAGEDRFYPLGNISKEFGEKFLEQALPKLDPRLSNTRRAGVIPELDCFWQGGFEVLRAEKLPECCDGLQAHFSSYALGNVFDAAKKFPPLRVQLEEVPCISFWPQHFHGKHAKEHNIVFFFFAKDIESYRSNYCKLLEKMLKYDLALKGSFGGFELLIFPSIKLSDKSQRWNGLLYLWGTFMGRRPSSLEVLSNGKEDPCKSIMDVNFARS